MKRKNGAESNLQGLAEFKAQKPKSGNGTKSGQEPTTPAAGARSREPMSGNGAKSGRERATPGTGDHPDPKTQSLLRQYEMAVRRYPEEAENWFRLGKLFLDLGDNRRAEALLNQAVRRSPGSANYHFHLGVALANDGKFAEAAGQFKPLANLDPLLTEPMSVLVLSALSRLAFCQGRMGDWEKAFATLLPAINTAISILGDLATILQRSGNYPVSCFLFTVALFLNPDDADLLHGAGYCQMKQGRLEEALDQLRKAAKANREDPHIWYDLGLTLAKMRNGKKARPCFRKALKLDAKHLWAWYDLACLDALDHKPDAAFRNLYKSIECGFKDKEYLLRDPDFAGIRKDPRWRLVLECISGKGGGEASNQGLRPRAVRDPAPDTVRRNA